MTVTETENSVYENALPFPGNRHELSKELSGNMQIYLVYSHNQTANDMIEILPLASTYLSMPHC